MIIGEIRRYLRDNNAVRVSRSVRDLAYGALAARDELAKVLTYEPSVEEIARHMRADPKAVSFALEAIVEPISLFEPVFTEGGDSTYVMDQIKDPVNTDENWLENIALSEALSKLGTRERAIIDMRFYKGKTQMEIAGEIGISQAQVSRLEKSALEKIKKGL